MTIVCGGEWQHAGRNGAGAIAESSHLHPQAQEREGLGGENESESKWNV